MAETLQERVGELLAETGSTSPDRAVLARAQRVLAAGAVPGPGLLRRLRRLRAMPDATCQRVEHDGACSWYRAHGPANRLPPVGERAFCPFRDGSWDACPGYKPRQRRSDL